MKPTLFKIILGLFLLANLLNIGIEAKHENEIDDDRFVLREPLKSLVSTATRFAIAQTNMTNHVNMDLAMGLLGDVGYMLSKPANMIKLIKAVSVGVASFLAASFFFPGAYQLVNEALNNPTETLNLDRYLSQGITERSVVGMVGSSTDEALNRIGLSDDTCREQSFCYLGLITRCAFPRMSASVSDFLSENFSSINMKDSLYPSAFIRGFNERTCPSVSTEKQQSCLSNIVDSFLLTPRQANDKKDKIKAKRSSIYK